MAMSTTALNNKQSNAVNIIKIIGFITMVIDHIGFFFFPELQVFRWIGRLAFPCFLYGSVNGLLFTKNVNRYAGRLFLMGLVSIVSWGFLFPFNIGFTLAFTVWGLAAYKKKDWTGVLLFGFLTLLSEYSLYAYLLGFLILWFEEKRVRLQYLSVAMIALHGAIGLILPSQTLAILFVGVWWFADCLANKDFNIKRVSKGFGYSFYPVHVFIFRVLSGV